MSTLESVKMTAEETERYFQLIDRLSEDNEDLLVSNGLPSHARHLVLTLLKGAKKSVSIHTEKLLRKIDGVELFSDNEIVNAATEFLKRPNSSLRILLSDKLDIDEGMKPSDHPFIGALVDNSSIKGACEIYTTDDTSFSFRQPFLVADGKAFRIELDPDKSRAVANFNDPRVASILTDFFDTLIKKSRPMDLVGG